MQEMDMAGYIHTEPPLVGHDMEVAGAITSEDAGFYVMLISAAIFMIAALTGHLA
ncbi:MAG TPA: hypothetical protein PKK11_07725 [Methanothrix sp.]|nr:hypothetical protein [Methanothrix sp.]